MKHKLILSMMLSAALLPLSCSEVHNDHNESNEDNSIKIQVRFSPHGGCQDQIISAINKAKESIRVEAYSFTALPIGEALIASHNRGVKVEIILDRSNESERGDSLLPLMLEHQIPVYIDSSHAIAHNKVMVIDNDTVLTGSMNFTKSGDKSNAENCIQIIDRKTYISYENDWLLHKQHSKLY